MSRFVVAAVTAALLVPAAAPAAPPRPGAILADDRHDSNGGGWHVQAEVNRRGTQLATAVVYSQRCKATGFLTKVPLSADGAFDIAGATFRDGGGTWSLQGAFSFPDRAEGTWSVTRGECTDGGAFRAQDASGHFLIGNPFEYAPPGIYGNSLAARRLRRIKYLSRLNAARFDTLAESSRAGYELSMDTGCPGMHHARKRGTAMWGKTLDPTAPQALMYWCDSAGNWTLAGFMYRAAADTRPSTFSNLLQWHRHGRASNWMAHVWLVPDPAASFATCAPFPAFEDSGLLRYEPYVIDIRADAPCSDSVLDAPPPSG